MFGEILFILFFIFNIPNSLCIGEDTMEEESSFFEVAMLHEEIFRYHYESCQTQSCWDIADKYSEACKLLWYKRRSSTDILSCAWLGEMTACILREHEHYYKWVKSSEHGIQGRGYASCPSPGALVSLRIGEDSRITEKYSSCHCDMIQYSWKVYVGELRSRESENYVIAGVRFKLRDQVLFLQPVEGKLEANGRISNRSWVPLPDDIYGFRSVTIHCRTIFLSDLKLDSGYVVTGIKFNRVDRGTTNEIAGYAMSISGLPFNDTTGKLDLTPQRRKTARDSPSTVWRQLIIPLKNPIRTEVTNHTYPSPQKYNYVRLERSELSDDFGQSTLPLFDSTSVSFKYAPLAGIAVFHKGWDHHAEYIALRLYPV